MNRDETGQISDENLERRVAAGCPAWGYRIVTLIMFLFGAILVFSALDWRFQWSPLYAIGTRLHFVIGLFLHTDLLH